MVVWHVDTRRCNDKVHIIIHTWTGLLRAPREYVLHGLILGLNWAPLWPHPISMHLVATPNPVSCCLLQRLKFHPNVFCYLGGFSLMYNQTSQQRYTIHGTHVYTVPTKRLGRYKKLNNFFPVIDRLLKWSFTEKGLYTDVWDEISLF